MTIKKVRFWVQKNPEFVLSIYFLGFKNEIIRKMDLKICSI